MGENSDKDCASSPAIVHQNVVTEEQKANLNSSRRAASGSIHTVVTPSARSQKRPIQRDTTLKLTALEDVGKMVD